MEITVEKPSELERCLKISLPEDLLEGKVVSRLTDLQKTARLDGFRKGKIPPKIVRQRFGQQVRAERALSQNPVFWPSPPQKKKTLRASVRKRIWSIFRPESDGNILWARSLGRSVFLRSPFCCFLRSIHPGWI